MWVLCLFFGAQYISSTLQLKNPSTGHSVARSNAVDCCDVVHASKKLRARKRRSCVDSDHVSILLLLDRIGDRCMLEFEFHLVLAVYDSWVTIVDQWQLARLALRLAAYACQDKVLTRCIKVGPLKPKCSSGRHGCTFD